MISTPSPAQTNTARAPTGGSSPTAHNTSTHPAGNSRKPAILSPRCRIDRLPLPSSLTHQPQHQPNLTLRIPGVQFIIFIACFRRPVDGRRPLPVREPLHRLIAEPIPSRRTGDCGGKSIERPPPTQALHPQVQTNKAVTFRSGTLHLWDVQTLATSTVHLPISH